MPVRFDAPVIEAPPRRMSADEQARAALRDEARRAGRLEGLEAARTELDAAVAAQRAGEAKLVRAAEALDAAAAELRGRDALTLQSIEEQAVALAVAIAEEIVGAELRACDDRVRAAICRAIGLAPDRGELLVRVHPADADAAGHALAAIPGATVRSTTVVADPAVEAGGCILEVGPCRVDAQIGAVRERLRVVLAT